MSVIYEVIGLKMPKISTVSRAEGAGREPITEEEQMKTITSSQ